VADTDRWQAGAGASPADEDEDVLFGRILLHWGWVPRDVLRQALAWQRSNAPGRRLGDVLVERGLLTREQAEQAAAHQVQVRTGQASAPARTTGKFGTTGATPSRGIAGWATPVSEPWATPGSERWSPTAPSSPPTGVAGWTPPGPGAALGREPPGGAVAVAMGPTPRPEDEDPLLGQVLKGCLVNNKLGAGAMGSVYLAFHEELRKDVVVKVLSAEHSARAKTVERFRREASAMARLEHPNVVMVFDCGNCPDGRPFMIMQYVDGADLEKRMEAEKRLAPAEATRVVLETARGLEAAHKLGVIHRDVKPENILLTSQGTAKISDFGLAKDTNLDPLTMDGTRVGTPLYMAPDTSPIDARFDIYSLGVTFYYLLTGVQPFKKFKAQEVFGLTAHKKVDPPETHLPDLPDPHRRVLGKMMAVDRRDRYADAAALIRDLEALSRGLPVEAPEPPDLWGQRAGGPVPDPNASAAITTTTRRKSLNKKKPAAAKIPVWQLAVVGGAVAVVFLLFLILLIVALK
jgi:tRNA A-37 threonylcarbamoyl transferase component Bud32